MAFQNESSVDTNFNYNYLVIQTTMKMRDAKATQQWWEYWVHFEFAMQLVLSYLEPKVAKDIELDYQEMDSYIDNLNTAAKNGALAEKTRDMQINLLRAEFCDKHRYYVLKALNKIGIVKVAEDGVVDFDSTDLETMSAVIRSKNEELLKPHAPVQQDMTLVIDPVSKKVFRMGTTEYKEYVDSKIYTKQQEVEKEPATTGPAKSPEEPAQEMPPADAPVEEKIETTNLPKEDETPPSEFKLRIGYPKGEAKDEEKDKSDAWQENADVGVE